LIILTHDKYYLNYIEPIKFFKNSDMVYIVGIRLAQWHPVQGNSHDSFYIHPEYLRQIMTKIDLVF